MAPSNKSCFHLLTALLLLGAITAFSNPKHTIPFRTTSALQAKISTYLDDGNYNQIMRGDKLVLVDACAQWCGPCKLIEPFLKQSADKYSSQLEVVKFDVEAKHNGGAKVEFLLQGVMPQALPSLILFHKGQHVATHNGALTQEQLDEFIETNLNAVPASSKKAEEERELVSADPTPAKKGLISFGGMRDDYAL